MKRLLNGLAVLSLVAVATPVLAQETAARPAARTIAPVSEADFVARRTANLRAMDANTDGQVTAEERRAAFEARRTSQRDAQFARLDANADGVISREEFSARPVRPEARSAQPRADRAHRKVRHTRSVVHSRPATEALDIAAVEQQARTQFAQLDTNGDGQVTAEERRAVRQQARSQRSSEGAGRHAGRRLRQASPSTPVSE